MDLTRRIAIKIKTARKAQKLTQEDLASLVGCPCRKSIQLAGSYESSDAAAAG